MTGPNWRRALVLGGTRSGKSEFAESLLTADEPVSYVATGWRTEADPDWVGRIEAHAARRPPTWRTVELGTDPWRLPAVLAEASAGQTVLVDELGTWVGAVMAGTDAGHDLPVARMAGELSAAVRACRAKVIVVSPEVGLAPVALTREGRRFVDALGAVNIAVSASCDTVVLVIAGNAVPVKGGL